MSSAVGVTVAVAVAGSTVVASAASTAACTSSATGDGVDSGCPSDLPTCANVNDTPSYKTDVAPLLERRCLECHADAGSVASRRDFSDYPHVYAQRSAILNNVYACKMPKPPAPPLPADERQKLLLWLRCNAPDN